MHDIFTSQTNLSSASNCDECPRKTIQSLKLYEFKSETGFVVATMVDREIFDGIPVPDIDVRFHHRLIT